MINFVAFTVVMLIWTFSEFVAKKTKSIVSSLFMAAIIFLIGFKSGLFPSDLLDSSSVLDLGRAVLGLVLVHIGTLITPKELKTQWKTVVVGVTAVVGVIVLILTLGQFFFDGIAYMIASIGAITGATVSVVIVQEAARDLGLSNSVLVLPVLVTAFQGLVGFPLSSIILKREAKSLHVQYQRGEISLDASETETEKKSWLPPLSGVFSTTPGTLFVVGVVAIISYYIQEFTNGALNMFIVCMLAGVLLRSLGLFKKGVLNGIDAYGLMMLGIMVIIYAPLATMTTEDLLNLLQPLVAAFVLGVSGNIIFSSIMGKILGYSIPMSIAIGLTALYGFPGTMILSQEAAKSVGESEEEVKVIESKILPKMIIAGFSTVTITSVIATSLLISYFSSRI